MLLPTAHVLVADPPWRFGDALPGPGRGAAKHYDTLSWEEIAAHKAFAFPSLTEDAVLFLWRVAAMQEEALAVISAWGFTLKTELVWRKTTSGGKRHFGMGRILRAEHEVCLAATRGRPQVHSHSVRSVFDAPVGRHSEKPEAFYKIVETLYSGPYVELFARRQRPGWTCLGNEAGDEVSGFTGSIPKQERQVVSGRNS